MPKMDSVKSLSIFGGNYLDILDRGVYVGLQLNPSNRNGDCRMAGKKASINEASKLDEGSGDDGRQRSRIGFPYMPLDDVVTMAQAIHAHVGMNECDADQLAAWTDQSPKSSSFRNQFYAGRTFGILEGQGEKHRLTELGRIIVDPSRLREGKAKAFLTVPLYKAIFEKNKGGVLPPAAALEREMVGLGVSEKQKERARQVFERSAEQAGFFEHGKNKLVMPGVASSGHHRKGDEHKPAGGGGGGGGAAGGGGPDDPLIAALIQKLPAAGTDWSTDERVAWLQLMIMGFQVAYGPKDQISVKKEAAN